MAVIRQLRRQQQQGVISPPGGEVMLRALTDSHPRYQEFLPRWTRFIDCYEGEHLERYLFQHLRESQKSIDMRRLRLYYLNYCQPVVDLYTHYIFAKPVVRKETPEELLRTPSYEGDVLENLGLGSLSELGDMPESPEASEWANWLRNVDRKGNSIDRYMADAARYAFTFGHVYIVVDMPRLPEGATIRSEADRLKYGQRPYLTTYFPSEMPDWGVDENGEFLWCRFREPLPEKNDPFSPRGGAPIARYGASAFVGSFGPSGRQTPGRYVGPERPMGRVDGIYRTWTRDAWFIHQVENGQAQEIGRGAHPCGRVPVVTLFNKRHSQYPSFGVSLIADICRINIAILNWSSLVDEEVYQKTLNILCMQRDREQKQEVTIGSDNVLEWEGTTAPFFLAPSTDPGAFIASMIDRARDEVYRLAKLGGGLGLVQPQKVPSGIAQAFEFNETNRTLAEHADEIEMAENQIHRIWHAWLGIEWQGTVDYPDDFSVESFADELDIVLKAKQTIRSPTFKREVEKRLVRKMLRNASPLLNQFISAEIEVMPELVITGFGPMYFDPTQQPAATPATAEEISRSPLTPNEDEEEAPAPPKKGEKRPSAKKAKGKNRDSAGDKGGK